jgi:hypothetical protein
VVYILVSQSGVILKAEVESVMKVRDDLIVKAKDGVSVPKTDKTTNVFLVKTTRPENQIGE